MVDLSVVLPCYNESGNLLAIMARYRPLAAPLGLELVLVDNGSTDNSAAVLAQATRSPDHAFVKVVTVPRNVGYGHGIQAGLREAQGAVLAINHADLQCDPESLVKAMDLYRQTSKSGPCLVKGRRRGARPLLDRLVTAVYNGLTRGLLNLKAFEADAHQGLVHPHVADVNAQPKVFSRALLPALLQGPTDFTFDLYVLHVAHQAGASIVEFWAEYKTRQWGRSKLAANPWVRLKTSFNAFRYLMRLAAC